MILQSGMGEHSSCGRRWPVWLALVATTACMIITRKADGLTSVKIVNECKYTVWPGLLTNSNGNTAGGFTLESGQTTALNVPIGWSGRLWGRTGCNFSSDGMGNCTSGDCGGQLECSGVGATPPVSLVEFTLGRGTTAKDFYDVSLVDGYNLPVTIVPAHQPSSTGSRNTSCGMAGCSSDVNKACPSELQVVVDGQVVACKSACLAFQTAEYCCSGAFANANVCKPTSYSRIFKAACPAAYSYAFDDVSSLFTCSSSNYTITFCPSASSSAPMLHLEALFMFCVLLFVGISLN